MNIDEVIRPIPKSNYTITVRAVDIERSLSMLSEVVNLNPEYQRGHVWTLEQQTKFMESLIRGLIGRESLLIRFNHPNWSSDQKTDLPDELQCVDGLQRLSAVKAYFDGQLHPFGLTLEQIESSAYKQRHNLHFQFHVYEIASYVELIGFYLSLNTGGTVHSESEIQRVKDLLK
jgi:hypothetical protein